MSRPFDFNDSTLKTARLRQFGLCAQCGECMNDLYEHGHHVAPNQSGDPAQPSHAWLKSAENCVILCETCHYAVHDSGRYQKGAVAPPDYYPHSHGQNSGAHKKWVADVNLKMDLLWGPKTGKSVQV